MDKYIVGIETSCDDTSIAILKNEQVLSCITKDSTLFLQKYGGIVPELVSRKHEEFILDVFEEAITNAKITKKDITDIIYTNEPGLPGSLHVGEIFAKSLGFLLDIKPIGVNHIHGHIFSPFINEKTINFPFLSLIASGKTTSIFLVKGVDNITELTKTLDDAIGESFDKIGKALNYSYPAGPLIDKNYDETKATIVIPKQPVNKDFSFSGVKTFILNQINKANLNNNLDPITIGSSYMKWAIETIIEKLSYYSNQYNIDTVCIGGGVASNSLFKKEIKKIFKNSFVPKKEYSCDNAAMIGFLGFLKKNIY